MALKNRTESKAVVTAWAPILDLEAVHKPDLRDEILNNCLFRKDVSSSTAASGTTKTLEFADIDYIEVAQSNNVAYTLNTVQQGEIKFLKITKTANQTISFVNATDVSIRKAFIDSTTVVIYRITNKDGDLYLKSINIDNDVILETKIISLGVWNMDTLASVLVVHGLDKDKIRTMDVMIWADDGTGPTPIDSYTTQLNGGIGKELGGNMPVSRAPAGLFDQASYSVTPTIDGVITRGYLTIGHAR